MRWQGCRIDKIKGIRVISLETSQVLALGPLIKPFLLREQKKTLSSPVFSIFRRIQLYRFPHCCRNLTPLTLQHIPALQLPPRLCFTLIQVMYNIQFNGRYTQTIHLHTSVGEDSDTMFFEMFEWDYRRSFNSVGLGREWREFDGGTICGIDHGCCLRFRISLSVVGISHNDG